MSLLSGLASLRGSLLWQSFQHRADQPDDTQRRLLWRILAANRDTAFGNRHHFARIASVAAYREQVPIGDYERFRPWLDRVEAGERRVLTEEQPDMFTLTSGTTGRPKLVPVTRTSTRGSSRLTAMWLYLLLRDHPTALDHKALVVVSPAVEGTTPGGIPVGSASGHTYQHASWAIRRAYAVPEPVFQIKDFDAKYYALLRFAIAQRVSFIATPNPSSILRLVTMAAEQRESLAHDVLAGTLSDAFAIPDTIRRRLQPFLAPDPGRGAQLQRLAAAADPFTPRDYWPDLRIIGCWQGGTVGLAIRQLRPWFHPETRFRDIGYLASEGQMTLPLTDECPSGVLALDTNFYEFIPETEFEAGSRVAYTAGQLEIGQTYYVILTTPTGLYRYDINDVVRVTGRFRNTPLIEFLRKGRDMTSLVGEKLHVAQLMDAVATALRTAPLDLAYYRAVGDSEGPRYELKLELRRDAEDSELRRFARVVDRELAALNIEYDQKRRSGRLLSPVVHVMRRGWGEGRARARIAAGQREAQFKDVLLGLPDGLDLNEDVLREVRLE